MELFSGNTVSIFYFYKATIFLEHIFGKSPVAKGLIPCPTRGSIIKSRGCTAQKGIVRRDQDSSIRHAIPFFPPFPPFPPQYSLFRFHGDKAEPGRGAVDRTWPLSTLGQLFAASSRGVGRLNASFVCTGEGEGCIRNSNSGVCAWFEIGRMERWLERREGTSCGWKEWDGRLMKLPILYEIVHVQRAYVSMHSYRGK